MDLKLLHLSCAAFSLSLFLLRGIWMLMDSPRQRDRWTRVIPHVVDTAFLFSGVALAWRLQQYPFVHAWLTAKIFGLITYIILGSIALKPGRSRILRASAFFSALAVFAYIVGVARYRHPLSWVLIF